MTGNKRIAAHHARPVLVVVRDLPADELAALENVARQLGMRVDELVAHALQLAERDSNGGDRR